MGRYVCKTCGIEKDESEFRIKQKCTLASGKIKEYRNCHCINCFRVSQNSQRIERYPHAWIRNRYGVDDAMAKYWYQRSMQYCEICGKQWKPGQERLCIDHDHQSGKLRGILCKHCNHVLGHSRESVQILDNAKAYLISHREN